MDSTQSAATEAAKTKVPFGQIHVKLTFDGYETMYFKFRRRLTEEEKAEKQLFLGLSDEEKKTAQHDYRVTTLANVLLEEPVGLPNYLDGLDEKLDGSLEAVKQRFRDYFANEDYDDILDWAFTQYSNKLFPKELFSTLSES